MNKNISLVTIIIIFSLLSLTVVCAQNDTDVDNIHSSQIDTSITNEISVDKNRNMNISSKVDNSRKDNINTGYVIYKVNQQTLKDENNNIIKSYIKDNQTTYNIRIPSTWGNDYINVETVYSGSKSYSSARSKSQNITLAKIKTNIINDIAIDSNRVISFNSNINNTINETINNGYLIYKINNQTLKDLNNNVVKSSIKNNIATYQFQVPNTWGRNNITVETVYSGYKAFASARSKSQIINLPKLKTNIVNDITVNPNRTITIKSRVDDSKNDSISYGYVIYKINNETIKSNNQQVKVNVKENTCTYQYNIPNTWFKDQLIIQSVYSGAKGFDSSRSTSETINIPRINTNIQTDSIITNTDKDVVIPVTVKDSYNRLVNEGNVSIYIDNKHIKTQKLSGGQANVNIGRLNNRTHLIKSVYNSQKYNSSSKTSTVKILPTTHMDVRTASYVYGEAITVSYTIYDNNNKTVNGGTLLIYSDNKLLLKKNHNSSDTTITLSNISAGNHKLKLSYESTIYWNTSKETTITIQKAKSNIYANSIQSFNTNNPKLELNVTDSLNNSINEGKLDLYLNNKLVKSQNITSDKNSIVLNKQNIGVYDLEVKFTSNNYISANKQLKLTVNPVSKYTIKLIYNPAAIANQSTKIRAQVRIPNSGTINTGSVKFYFNNTYMGTNNTKNNLTSKRINLPVTGGDYPVKVEYYLNNTFIGADCQIMHVRDIEKQVKQETFITMMTDLVSNSKITSTKKDVYFAMDRTTSTQNNYSPNDMKIMNNIAYNLNANGFNVKTIKNGPGETYETARYMYNNNIKNSICFVLCNGVDANVIREYLKGNDRLLTAVRNRGNDIVLGWFYGAGNIYDSDGEYYYWLEKAWDDNYSNKGGIANPRKVMEDDGIKVIYEHYDLKGDDVAKSFIKLYGGKVTENITKNSVISVKTNLYNITNKTINKGNVIYTLNDKIIKNITINSNVVSFKFTMPNVSGTYDLKATYYLDNTKVASTDDRYIKVI